MNRKSAKTVNAYLITKMFNSTLDNPIGTTDEKKPPEDNIYLSLKPVFRTAQFMGLFPVELSNSGMIFQWKSIKMIYTFLATLAIIISFIFTFIESVSSSFTLKRLCKFENCPVFCKDLFLNFIANQVFYFGSLVTYICYLKLAKEMPNFIQKNVES